MDRSYLIAAQLVQHVTTSNMRRVLSPFEFRMVLDIYNHLIRRAGENTNDRVYSES